MVEDTKETEHSLHDRADSRQQLLVTGRQRPAFRELGLDAPVTPQQIPEIRHGLVRRQVVV